MVCRKVRDTALELKKRHLPESEALRALCVSDPRACGRARRPGDPYTGTELSLIHISEPTRPY